MKSFGVPKSSALHDLPKAISGYGSLVGNPIARALRETISKYQRKNHTEEKTCGNFVENFELKHAFPGTISGFVSCSNVGQVREGGSLTRVGNTFHLIGGYNSERLQEVLSFDFQGGVFNRIALQHVGMDVLGRRYGHTATEYKGLVYVFGGEHSFMKSRLMRKCLNDLVCYDPVIRECSKICYKGHVVIPRRFHCSARYGRYLFIIGGSNDYGKPEKEIAAIDMQDHCAFKIEVQNPQEGRINAALCAVTYSQKRKANHTQEKK